MTFPRIDAATSEYLAALKELAVRGVTPLEILSLAETRRKDPALAMKIAEQSAKQNERNVK